MAHHDVLAVGVLQAARARGLRVPADVAIVGFDDTTADVLERFDPPESARPSRVLVMLGANDARAHGRISRHRMVTTYFANTPLSWQSREERSDL